MYDAISDMILVHSLCETSVTKDYDCAIVIYAGETT
jgi:hypothetical protein